jgi:hypothetical protein
MGARERDESVSAYLSMIDKMAAISWGVHVLVPMKWQNFTERIQDELR